MWYLHWGHPELFRFALTLAALLAMRRTCYPLAVAAAALASLQNQALVLLVAYLGICGLWRCRSLTDAALLAGAALPCMLPPLYNYAHFGMFSIQAGWLSTQGLAGKMLDVFFDLNVGLLPYLPISLLAYFGLLTVQLLGQRRLTRDHQLFAVMLAMMSVACMQSNWNNDATGPMRYSIWMVLPILFLSLATNIELLLRSRPLQVALGLGVALQAGIVIWLGPFDSQLSFVEHSPAARFVLEHAPSVYDPHHEIFCERVAHAERACDGLAIYESRAGCHKALVRCDRLPELATRCASVPIWAESRCASPGPARQAELFYVDY